MTEKKLTVKQKKFVKAIASGKSATEAAIKAGYSKRSAKVTACRALTKTNIVKAVEKEVDSAAKKAGVSPEWVYKSLKHLHDFNSQIVVKDDSDEMINAPVALDATKSIGKFLRMGEKVDDTKDETLKILAETLREKLSNE
nr:MAG TPA: Terminase small subunit [Caudoviricetes sp.]